jgi:hypothetical protein
MVEHFYIYEPRHLPQQRHANIENMQWLKCFYPFTGVKNLYLSEKLAPSIAHANDRSVARPAKYILEGLQSSVPVPEGIGKFFSARQLSGHLKTVSVWERDWKFGPGLAGRWSISALHFQIFRH